MADWHPLVIIPLGKLAMGIQNPVPLEIFEPQVVPSICGKARNVDACKVTFNKRPEFGGIFAGEFTIKLAVTQFPEAPSHFNAPKAVGVVRPRPPDQSLDITARGVFDARSTLLAAEIDPQFKLGKRFE